MEPNILRYNAFALTAQGGNPAGVVLDAAGLGDADMLRIAAELGFPESAFVTSVTPGSGDEPAAVAVRYFSPAAEVPFCGHATVATAVALAEQQGLRSMLFSTAAGDVPLLAKHETDGTWQVSFTSVPTQSRPIPREFLAELLGLLGLTEEDLDPDFPALESFAGNWHPVLVLAERELFHQFRFEPRALAALMLRAGWRGTVTVLSPLTPASFEARNLFPVGRITEDPATGSAAASTGAYLRQISRLPSDGRVEILQGSHVGRPSRLLVQVPAEGGVTVTGGATRF